MIDNVVTQFLGKEIFVNSFIHIDLWTFVHILSSVFIVIILLLFIKKFFKLIGVLLVLLILWEIFEYILYGIITPPLISSETFVDLFTDIAIGFLAGTITTLILILNKNSKKQNI